LSHQRRNFANLAAFNVALPLGRGTYVHIGPEADGNPLPALTTDAWRCANG
jgi:hypothetical protein